MIMEEDRKKFLVEMYKQMFNDIDRHHKIVWQILGVLIGSFSALALIEKNVISIDMATGIIILLALWVIIHVYDSNYWYNRNLVIIANIERQFLKETDLKEIQYYFGKHRDSNSIQTSLKIQLYFCWIIVFLFLLYHFINSLLPGFHSQLKWENIRFQKAVPYISLILGVYFVIVIKSKRIKDYKEFLANSPGIKINTTGINYGGGHPSAT